MTKYKSAWKKWVEWSSSYDEVETCPAKPLHVAIYLNDFISQNCNPGALSSAVLGIRWGHKMCGVETPTENSIVKLALEGGKRIISEKRLSISHQKEPLSMDLLKEIISKFSFSKNLLQFRFVIMCVLGFFGFLRISELLNLKIKDIEFASGGVKITIEKSKTDQLREGHIVHIAETNTEYCPIKLLKDYLTLTKLENEGDSYLFCRLSKTKHGHNAIGKYRISYTTALNSFKNLLSEVTNDTCYSLHSLRSGGASEAANNGVSDRLISKHGRWKSTTSRDRYIKDDQKNRFKVTKSLGI